MLIIITYCASFKKCFLGTNILYDHISVELNKGLTVVHFDRYAQFLVRNWHLIMFGSYKNEKNTKCSYEKF